MARGPRFVNIFTPPPFYIFPFIFLFFFSLRSCKSGGKKTPPPPTPPPAKKIMQPQQDPPPLPPHPELPPLEFATESLEGQHEEAQLLATQVLLEDLGTFFFFRFLFSFFLRF